MLKEIFIGAAQRIRLENSLQLQRAKLVRPKQVRLEVAKAHREVQMELEGDAELQKLYEGIVIHVD